MIRCCLLKVSRRASLGLLGAIVADGEGLNIGLGDGLIVVHLDVTGDGHVPVAVLDTNRHAGVADHVAIFDPAARVFIIT